jgi:hypothetical protein
MKTDHLPTQARDKPKCRKLQTKTARGCSPQTCRAVAWSSISSTIAAYASLSSSPSPPDSKTPENSPTRFIVTSTQSSDGLDRGAERRRVLVVLQQEDNTQLACCRGLNRLRDFPAEGVDSPSVPSPASSHRPRPQLRGCAEAGRSKAKRGGPHRSSAKSLAAHASNSSQAGSLS